MGSFFNFIDSLGGAFGGFSIAQAVTQLLLLIIKVARLFFSVLGFYVGRYDEGFSYVGGWATSIWDGFFKRVLGGLFSIIGKLHDWLEHHLGPILRFLKRLRDTLDRWYKLYIRPYLELIQKLRRYLAILRALHIKWAEELDKKLAHAEFEISQAFLKIRGVLNNVIDLVSLVIDPGKLIRKPHIIVSIRRSIPGIVRAATGLPIGHFFPAYGPAASPEERAPADSGCHPSLASVTGLPFKVPYATSGLADFFVDAETGEGADDLADFAPLAFFQENFMSTADVCGAPDDGDDLFRLCMAIATAH